MTDATNLIRLFQEIKPNEVYNLAAQSHVKVSFDLPEYTAETDGIGTLRILEAIRICGLEKKQKYIRPQPLNFMEKFKKFLKMKVPHFIQDLHMGLQNYMHIGLPKIIENPMGCLRLTEFYLITNLKEEEKLLCQEK